MESDLPDTAPVLEVAAPVDDESDDGSVDAECADDPEVDGSAEASHGVAPSAAPMPSATANAPTRPMYLEYPIVGSLPGGTPLLDGALLVIRADRQRTRTPHA